MMATVEVEAPPARRQLQELKDPFTLRRLTCFLLIHLFALGAELAAIINFVFTGDIKFAVCLLIPMLFSGMFCTHAAWTCDLPHSGSRFLPLREKPVPVALLCVVPLGLFQGVIILLALEEYFAKNTSELTGVTGEVARALSAPRLSNGSVRRTTSLQSSNKYHCKAIHGLFEGISSSVVLLYAFWSMGVGDPVITERKYKLEPGLVGFLGIVCFLSAGLGLMELDYCTSRAIAKRMQRSPRYEVFHWLFRTSEVTSRVCMFVAFMVTTRQTPGWEWWWCILVADLAITCLLVTVFGGAESSWWIRLLCSLPCVFANIFNFIDSPYKRRAAKHLSIWMTTKHLAEQIALPLVLYMRLENFEVDLRGNWKNHKIMIMLALSCTIMYWLLLWYLSCKSLHKSNMLDIYSACETGSVTEVRSVMRRLTNSPAVCLNVNSPDVDGNTPLMLAAGKGHADVCALLIKEGARVDVRRFKDNRKIRTCTVAALRRRWTALHLAAYRGHLKVVQVLLEGAGLLHSARPSSPAAAGQELEGVGVGFRDICGQTPLHIAARQGYTLMCCFLAHHVPSWKEALDSSNCRPVDVAWSTEAADAIGNPSPELLDEVAQAAGGELARVPLLPGAAAVSGEEAWPQVQLAIARSSAKEQLLAPGLCSYIASSCGGALGRVFLTLAEPNELDQHGVSVLTDISEGTEQSGSFTLAALPVLDSSPPDGPSMADLCPVNRQQQPVDWWMKMAQDAAPTPASPSTSRGALFARVPPEAILGEGSYGVVWRALDSQTKKIYAVKNIRQKQNTSDVSRREFEVADHIRMKPHPCIVQLFLVHNYQDAGLYVLVMEFCPGGDLLGRIKANRNRLGPRRYEAPPQAIPWIAQVFLGLEHMHKRMLTLLRDLKPENVVLSQEGCAKLTDFGFGRFGVESVGIWSFGVPTGSPGYVAPEVLAQQTYDSRADLYSLGVLVWVLLTGGLLNKADPLPPMGKMRWAGDFQAHLKDCEMLRRCLEQPESNAARRMRPVEQDFVAKLIPRQPADRMGHQGIREHPLLSGQLPTYSATWAEVTTWLRSQGAAAGA